MHLEPPERGLLIDALGLDGDAVVSLLSREPLGDGSIAGFAVGSSQGRLTYYVDTSRRRVAKETGMLVGSVDEPQVRVWLHPSDPHLPTLAPVAFSHAAESLLARLGVRATGAPQMMAYRAGRRAVLRVPVEGDAHVWVKAVPPGRVSAIVASHRALEAAGIPVPHLRGWSEDGLVVWDAATGTPAQDAPWTPDGLLGEVDALRARISTVPLHHTARTRLATRRDWYAERLVAVLPPGPRDVVSAVVARARADWDDGVLETVHGDLHFGQLFLDEDLRISGVIDVDTAGRGAAGEDAGAFLAHAVASALLTPAPEDTRVWELARRGLGRWDAADVRARTAAHLLGHVIGAWEAGDHDRALDLVALADAVSTGDRDALGAASRT